MHPTCGIDRFGNRTAHLVMGRVRIAVHRLPEQASLVSGHFLADFEQIPVRDLFEIKFVLRILGGDSAAHHGIAGHFYIEAVKITVIPHGG
ncbi:hypothetical protein D3C73_1024520 [compost metagenome]